MVRMGSRVQIPKTAPLLEIHPGENKNSPGFLFDRYHDLAIVLPAGLNNLRPGESEHTVILPKNVAPPT